MEEANNPVPTWSDKDMKIPYKTRRCARKFQIREKCMETDPVKFTEEPKDIWEVDYFSSSDEEDLNNSEENSGEESEDENSDEASDEEQKSDLK